MAFYVKFDRTTGLAVQGGDAPSIGEALAQRDERHDVVIVDDDPRERIEVTLPGHDKPALVTHVSTDSVKRAQCSRIDKAARAAVAQVVPSIYLREIDDHIPNGQQIAIHQAKEAEARAILSGQDGGTSYLAKEAALIGVPLAERAATVLARAEADRAKLVAIETRRIAARAQVRAAETIPNILAAAGLADFAAVAGED